MSYFSRKFFRVLCSLTAIYAWTATTEYQVFQSKRKIRIILSDANVQFQNGEKKDSIKFQKCNSGMRLLLKDKLQQISEAAYEKRRTVYDLEFQIDSRAPVFVAYNSSEGRYLKRIDQHVEILTAASRRLCSKNQ